MTRLKAPIHSQAASGKMDEETILVTRRGKTYRKRYVVPRNADTKGQREVRRLFSKAMKLWESELSSDEREAWAGHAKRMRHKDRLTGDWVWPDAHVAFQTFARRALRAGLEVPRLPPSNKPPFSPVLILEKKGKDILVSWRREEDLMPGARRGPKPALLELRVAVSKVTVKAPARDHRLVGFFPVEKGEFLYLFDPEIQKGEGKKKLGFLALFLTPDAQESLPSSMSIIIP
jgi:hypothetical protein